MTTVWRNICCPVDFSEPALAALRLAADLCRRLGSDLVLLYADAEGKLAEELPRGEPAGAQLSAWREEALQLGAARVTCERVRGQPELAIVDYARRSGVDLIVMGTHGRTDREGMLTGSVAEGVVRSAPCPVLTVHPGWQPRPASGR